MKKLVPPNNYNMVLVTSYWCSSSNSKDIMNEYNLINNNHWCVINSKDELLARLDKYGIPSITVIDKDNEEAPELIECLSVLKSFMFSKYYGEPVIISRSKKVKERTRNVK